MKCPSFPKGAAKLEESEEQNDRNFPKNEWENEKMKK